MNRVKNGVFLVRKWSYTTFNIVNIRKMWGKKVIRHFYPENGNFYPENGNFPEIGPRANFLVPPKFGARSPPMKSRRCRFCESMLAVVYNVVFRQELRHISLD